MRIAKAIAHSGYCSRRDAEKLIFEGKVHLNSNLVTTPATFVTETDIITVNNKPIASAKPKLWLYHKPCGLITTHQDPQNRPTVFQNFKEHLISVGRLDFNSEGLLLLTNYGPIAHYAERSSWERTYRVKVYGNSTQERLNSLKKPFEINGIRYKPFQISGVLNDKKNNWLTIKITEGKNREIRKAMEHIGLCVSKLIRTEYGPFQLGDLELNKRIEVSQQEILKHFPLF